MDADSQADILQQRATAAIFALEACGHQQAHGELPTAEAWQRAHQLVNDLRARCDVLSTALVKLIIAPEQGAFHADEPGRWSTDDVKTTYTFPPEWGVKKAPPIGGDA